MIAAPADGPVSWTDRGDEAEAAAVILAGREPVDGPVTPTLGQLLGREPRTVRDLLAERLAA